LAPPAATGTRSHKIVLSLTVHDADGNSVPKFEAMLHTYQEGYIQWQSGQDGEIHFGADDTDSLWIREDPHFQVIVRAPDLAPAIMHLEDCCKEEYEGNTGPEAAKLYFEANRENMLEGTEVLWPKTEEFNNYGKSLAVIIQDLPEDILRRNRKEGLRVIRKKFGLFKFFKFLLNFPCQKRPGVQKN